MKMNIWATVPAHVNDYADLTAQVIADWTRACLRLESHLQHTVAPVGQLRLWNILSWTVPRMDFIERSCICMDISFHLVDLLSEPSILKYVTEYVLGCDSFIRIFVTMDYCRGAQDLTVIAVAASNDIGW